MCMVAGDSCAPRWATTAPIPAAQSPERAKWSAKFRGRWSALAPDQRFAIHRTDNLHDAESRRWQLICAAVQLRLGRRALRSGQCRFTGAQIVAALQQAPEGETLRAATHADRLNTVALGRWLKDRLVGAPVNGLVLRSKQRRDKTAEYWITRGIST
jgi:hypothetical protein